MYTIGTGCLVEDRVNLVLSLIPDQVKQKMYTLLHEIFATR